MGNSEGGSRGNGPERAFKSPITAMRGHQPASCPHLVPKCGGGRFVTQVPDGDLLGQGCQVIVTAKAVENHVAGHWLHDVSNPPDAKLFLEFVPLKSRTSQDAEW